MLKIFDIHKNNKQINVLLLEWDTAYALTLKQEIEARFAVTVTTAPPPKLPEKYLH